MVRIVVVPVDGKYEKLAIPLRKTLKQALCLLIKKEKIVLEVYLINNRLMRRLNEKFRHQDKTTNVLAFANAGFPRPDSGLKFAGEIYLAPDYIRTKKQNPGFLAVHGLLHLLGYTHEKKGDTIKMKKKEAWLMSSLR